MDELNGFPDLTDPERDLLAHLTTLTIASQLKPERSYEQVSDALSDIAHDGDVLLRGDDQDIYVLIRGRVICHAQRAWLRWMALQVVRTAAMN